MSAVISLLLIRILAAVVTNKCNIGVENGVEAKAPVTLEDSWMQNQNIYA